MATRGRRNAYGALLIAWVAGCSGDDGRDRQLFGMHGSAGGSGSGGAGIMASGGATGSGGTVQTGSGGSGALSGSGGTGSAGTGGSGGAGAVGGYNTGGNGGSGAAGGYDTGGNGGTGTSGAPSTGGVQNTGGVTGTGGCSTAGSAGVGGFGGGFSMAMPIPPVLSPTSTDATTDYYSITVKTGTAQMRAGSATPIVGFNGMFPGPTIVATKGRQVQVTQTNGWTESITIHNHGHKVAATSDGHPIDYILPAGQKTYTYPNDQSGGTYWYHDHAMDLTGAHVYKGIAGFYLIHDPAEDALNLPTGSYDIPLLLQDKRFNGDNTLSYDPSQDDEGFLAGTAVVNGVVTPHFDVSRHKYRFRILNAANARNFRLRLTSGKSFQIIASDGGLLAAPVTVTSLNVAPSERYDVVIDFAQYAVGAADVLTNTDQDFPDIGDLLQFRVTSAACDSSVVPATLSSISRMQAGQAVGTRTLTFSQDNNDWTINGLIYDPARIDVTSKLNSVYVWELDNQSRDMHPFHKHLVQFQILDIDGSPPPPEQRGWKDTVAVPSDSRVRIIFRNETFTGTYVFHCHRLEHEDHRMMLQESVVP